MNAAASCLVVIPAQDEAATIGEVVAEVRTLGHPVLVVNDASRDATSRLARAAGAEVLDLPCRLGAWGASQTGIRLALRQGFRVVVTIDADGQHAPADIGVVVRPILDGVADLVIGACPERGSRARRLAWRLFRLLSGLALTDLTSGFRAYGEKAAREMLGAEATLADFQDVGILLIAMRRRLRIVELPVAMCPRASGKSRIFYSWPRVLQYMLYTVMVSCLRR